MVKSPIMQQKNGNGSLNNSFQILIDADALVGITDQHDGLHAWAIETSVFLKRRGIVAALSNFSFGEAVTIISQRLGKKIALLTVEKILSSTSIIDATNNQRITATNQFLSLRSKNTRFTDCINMAMMDELGIDTIFSHDIHYKQAGYRRLGIDGVLDIAPGA